MQRCAPSLVPSPGGTGVHLSQGIKTLRVLIGREKNQKSLVFECSVENCTVGINTGLEEIARAVKHGSSRLLQLALWVVSYTARLRFSQLDRTNSSMGEKPSPLLFAPVPFWHTRRRRAEFPNVFWVLGPRNAGGSSALHQPQKGWRFPGGYGSPPWPFIGRSLACRCQGEQHSLG